MASVCKILLVIQYKNNSVMPHIMLGARVKQIFNILVVSQAIVTIFFSFPPPLFFFFFLFLPQRE